MKSYLARTVFCLVALFLAAAPALAQGEAEQHLKRSFERLAARDVEGALSELDRAVALKPDYAEAYAQRSRLRVLKGDVPGALSDLDRAVEHAPETARFYAERGRLRMVRRDADGALADYDSAIARGHRADEIYAARGHLKLILGRDAASAIDDYTTAISLNPERIGHYIGRYNARSKAGDAAGAVADLDYVIGQYERREQERLAAGKKPRQAPEFDLQSPTIVGPEPPPPPPNERGGKDSDKAAGKVQTQTALRVTAVTAGGRDNAEQFQYMINVANAYLNRGQANSNRGDTAAALRDFDKAIEINPHESVAYYARAWVRRNLGRLEDALADFTKAAELQPGFAFSHLERGATLLMLGRDAEAEKSFAEAVRRDPGLRQRADKRRAEALGKREEKRQ